MPKLKRFIVRKYVMADSVAQAVRKEREVAVDDCWVDEAWMKDNSEASGKIIGFICQEKRKR